MKNKVRRILTYLTTPTPPYVGTGGLDGDERYAWGPITSRRAEIALSLAAYAFVAFLIIGAILAIMGVWSFGHASWQDCGCS